MISLEGLTLATGRRTEAGWILRTFAHYVKHGLIPNFFPEGHQTGLYHTADASLWFFHALARYVDVTQDLTTLRLLMPKLHRDHGRSSGRNRFRNRSRSNGRTTDPGGRRISAHLDGCQGQAIGS